MIRAAGLLAVLFALVVVAFVFAAGCGEGSHSRAGNGNGAPPRLLAFVGAASKPATEELVAAFTNKTGIEVDVTFGGSGHVLAQMEMARQGDLYFPGSSDYMQIAKRKGLVDPASQRVAVYLVPAINVQRGNPKNIRTLADLTRRDVRVAIANPEGVCVGMVAVEILEANLDAAQLEAFRRNLANYAESCERVATSISLGSVDAVLGWRVFEHWDPERIETVALPASQIPRIGTIPLAISRYSQQPELAQRFIDFALSEQGQAIFRAHNYFTTAAKAVEFIGEDKPVGGEYEVPASWLSR